MSCAILEVEPDRKCRGDRRRNMGPVDRGHVGEAIPGGRAGGPDSRHARQLAQRLEIHYTASPTEIDSVDQFLRRRLLACAKDQGPIPEPSCRGDLYTLEDFH